MVMAIGLIYVILEAPDAFFALIVTVDTSVSAQQMEVFVIACIMVNCSCNLLMYSVLAEQFRAVCGAAI